ncbi:MAG: hypothetical protein MR848_06595 [Butyricimonas virosa]|nr:hypothetical protein [Butyricimonas virosa]
MPSWSEILRSVEANPNRDKQIEHLAAIRFDYLERLAQKTGRNVITYYSAFLQKSNVPDIAINDKDINAFMEAVHKLPKEKGLDLILHTPGGDIATTEKIINYLHSIFNGNIRAIIPQMAMSAGSMISVSCKAILMGKQSCLGPFDPQLNGVPCQSVLKEFEQAKNDVRTNPNSLGLWQVIIANYKPTFLLSCAQAVKLSNELIDNILKNSVVAPDQISEIKKTFGDNDDSKTHSRHISKEKCKEVGLNIIDLEEDQELQDLVLSIHHCYMITFEKTIATKVVENSIGGCYLRFYQPQNEILK